MSSYSREQNSPMGLDVALEEINHLLEADMSDASRNVYKGEGIYLKEVPIKFELTN